MRDRGVRDLRRTALRRERQGRRGEAFNLFRQLLGQRPDDVEALMHLGAMAADLGRTPLAARFFRHVVTIVPDDGQAKAALAGVVTALRDELRRDAGQAEAHYELGMTLRTLGEYAEALRCHRRALALDPRLAERDDRRAIPLLAEGRLHEGWWEFEWRATVGGLGPFTDRAWEGDDLAGKTVLVWGEQGIGDQMMFATCLPDVIERAGHCLIEVDRRLVPLFARSFPTATVHGTVTFRGDRPNTWSDLSWLNGGPPVDCFVLLGSLPRFFRPRLESFPERARTLVADGTRRDELRRRLSANTPGNRLVGVCWRSLLLDAGRQDLYPALDLWEPVFRLPDTTFVCLQAGASRDEIDDISRRIGAELAMVDVDLVDDLDGTAALIAALDAVVSADTYIPMTAGALGLPTWMAARADRGRIWSHLGAESFPWFPSLRATYTLSDDELREAFAAAAAGISDGC